MIRRFDAIGGGMARYHYGIDKQRTRKHIRRNGGGVVEDRIYLGGFELYRRRNSSGTVLEEIESHHLFEGEQRVLLVDDVITTDRKHANGTPYRKQPILRYQYSNHLGSVALELDEAALIKSYEEFHPYGTSAFRLTKAGTEARGRRFRYSGMERDEESVFNYQGSRYLDPRLGRWASTDSLGTAGGVNLFAYAALSPLQVTDRRGTQPKSSQADFSDWDEADRTIVASRTTTASQAEARRDSSPRNSAERRFWESRRATLAYDEGMQMFRVGREKNAKQSWAIIGGFFISAGSMAVAGALGLGMLAGAGGASAGVGAKILIGVNAGLIGSGMSVILQQAFRTAIDAPLLSETEVLLDVALSSLSPVAVEGLPAGLRAVKRLPASARMDAAVAADAATPLFPKGADAEPYALSRLEQAAADQGKVSLPSKLKRNQGLDNVAQGADKSSIDATEIKTIFDYEAGDLQSVVARLKDTKTLGRQMSEQYVSAQAVRLIGQESADLQATGYSILGATNRTRHIIVVDKFGNLHSIDPTLADLAMDLMPSNWSRPFGAARSKK